MIYSHVITFPCLLIAAAVALVLLCYSYLNPYLRRPSLRTVPGPPLAAWTNLWLMYQCRRGRRYLAVDNAHKTYGKFVRIQPHHVSIADPEAIPIVYGHGNGLLKSEYYDAFVSVRRGLFNTRDRAEHTRKRKAISHTFSAKSVGQFEQYIHANLALLVRQWDALSEACPGTFAEIDSLSWLNYTAFDIIGDLAFGTPFGMLERARDVAEVQGIEPGDEPRFAAAIQVLNRRGEVSATLGCFPALKPFAKYLPDAFFRKGIAAVEDLAGIASACVNRRLEEAQNGEGTNARVDLLARLMEAKDEHGRPLGRSELIAEALTQLIAGSDTTSNTSCALLYHCLTCPDMVRELQAELDGAVPPGVRVPDSKHVRDLPYLDKVIRETLRLHSTSSLGLPRVIPDSHPGLHISGRYFPPGTVLSVPSYTVHHDRGIWGRDADAFRPSRWDGVTEEQKAAFIPFGHGPRSCVGRNVAELELALIVSTVFLNYDFEPRQGALETREGFLRKPLALRVGIRRRDRGAVIE